MLIFYQENDSCAGLSSYLELVASDYTQFSYSYLQQLWMSPSHLDMKITAISSEKEWMFYGFRP